MSLAKSDRAARDVKFVLDVVFSFIGPLILRFRSFLLIPLIIRQLSVSGYGIWSQFEVTTSLLITLSSLNLGVGMNRLLVGDLCKEQISDDTLSIMSVQFLFALFMVTPLIIWPNWIADLLFGDAGLQAMSFCLAFIVLVKTIGNCFRAMMRARRLNKELASIEMVRWGGEFLVVAGVVFWTRSLVTLFVALSVYNLFSNMVYPLFSLSRGVYELKTPRFSRISQYLRFSLPLFGNTIGFWIIDSADKYLIRWFLGVESVGIYAAIYKFGNLIMLILTPIIEVLLPDMSSLYDMGELAEMKRRLSLTLRYYAIISGLAIIGLVGASRLLIAIIDLEGQSVLMLTSLLFLLSLSSTLMGLTRILLDGLSVKGKTWTIGWVWVGSAVFNVTVSLLLVPLLGMNGAALSAFLVFAGCLVVVTLIVERSYSQFFIWKDWGRLVLLSLIPSLLFAWLMTITIPIIPLGALLGMGVFVILLFITNVLNYQSISSIAARYVAMF